jgi:hypothetical protein
MPPYLIYTPKTAMASPEIIRFGDDRDLRGDEVVVAEGRSCQLKGLHRETAGAPWYGHFDAERVVGGERWS